MAETDLRRASEVAAELRSRADPTRAAGALRFFKWHEVRSVALLAMVRAFGRRHATDSERAAIYARRIAIIATAHVIKRGDAAPTLRLAPRLFGDREDLIHKAAGWMLHEVGKRVDRATLCAFLDRHAGAMPRTALRYAIEHLPAAQRRRYLDAPRVAAAKRARPARCRLRPTRALWERLQPRQGFGYSAAPVAAEAAPTGSAPIQRGG